MHVDVRKVLYRVQEYFWRTALLPVINFPRGRNLVWIYKVIYTYELRMKVKYQ